MKRIYCDHNATSPLAPDVLDAMRPHLGEHFGNASSVHHFGRGARYAVEKARRQVARLLGVAVDEILFTSGGTESDHLAIQGAALAGASRGRHLVTTAIEHPAVLGACASLADFGFETTHVAPDRHGVVSAEAVAAALRPETALVSVMTANSETGVLQPVREVAAVCRDRGVRLHTDAVQAVGRIPVSPRELGVDLLSLSAHKFHGPQGAGALWVREGVVLRPLMGGGHQERGLRPGTENVAALVGLGAAAERAALRMEDEGPRIASMRATLQERLEHQFGDEMLVIGRSAPRLPGTLNVCFRGLRGTHLVEALDQRGIAASTGSACSSGSGGPSHVLRAMDIPEALIDGGLRLSLGTGNDPAELDRVVEALGEAVAALTPR